MPSIICTISLPTTQQRQLRYRIFRLSTLGFSISTESLLNSLISNTSYQSLNTRPRLWNEIQTDTVKGFWNNTSDGTITHCLGLKM